MNDLKTFSVNFNSSFNILNSLTGKEIVKSSVSSDLDSLIITILDRDVEFNINFDVKGHGMVVQNNFIRALKKSKSNDFGLPSAVRVMRDQL